MRLLSLCFPSLVFYATSNFLPNNTKANNNITMAADADTYAGVMQRNKLASDRYVYPARKSTGPTTTGRSDHKLVINQADESLV